MGDENAGQDLSRTVSGKLQAVIGSLTGDTNRSGGEAQGVWGQVVDELRDFVIDQPFTALLTAVGFGAAVGFFTVRR